MKRCFLSSGVLAAIAFALLIRQGARWGAKPAEIHQDFPGDEIIRKPDLQLTNAVPIQAQPQAIWPWIVQMGYYRGGWHTDSTWRDWDYYPDRLLRFFVRKESGRSSVGHREAPTTARILPEFQALHAGDRVLDGPPGTAFFTVAAIEPEQYLVYLSDSHLRFVFPPSIRENPRFGIGGEFTWAFYLLPDGLRSTRLLMRTRGVIRPSWYRAFIRLTIPLANLFLARKMLSGIRSMVERSLNEKGTNSS